MRYHLILGNLVYSSWSLRGWLLFEPFGIDFDYEVVPLYVPEYQRFLQENYPAPTVPTLVVSDGDDSQTIWDSLAIAEYLHERHPQAGIWPTDPGARAAARTLCAEMHSSFHVLRECMPMNCRAMGRKVSLPDVLTDDIDRIIAIWSECHNKFSGDGGWLFGHFTVADAMFAPVVLRFRTYGINLPESAGFYPHRVLESEAMQDWLAAAECEVEVIEREEKGR